MALLQRLVKGGEGQTLAEYAMLVGFITVVAVAAVAGLGLVIPGPLQQAAAALAP